MTTMQTVSGVERMRPGHPQSSAQKMAMASRASEEMPVRELKSQGSTKLVQVSSRMRKRQTMRNGGAPGGKDGDGEDEREDDSGRGADIGDDAKESGEDAPECGVGDSDEEEAEAEEDAISGVDGCLKDEVLADASGGVLEGLGHEIDAADASEEKDAIAKLFPLQQEIDGEDDNDTDGSDGTKEAHGKLGGGLELGSIGIDDEDWLNLGGWLLYCRGGGRGAGGQVSADVFDGSEGAFERLLCG